ncbi:MAG: nuclear transport factor 2 family protein [Bryobacteraceae bacterium]
MEMTMTTEEALERVVDLLKRGNLMAVYDFYADDAVEERPQSGERIVGKKNVQAVNDAYPEMPTVTPRRVLYAGNLVVAEATMDYGENGKYDAVSVFGFKDGKIVRETSYWAEPFAAPERRSQYVEKIA